MPTYDTNGQAVEHHIHWGAVLKGAAIVAGVVVAAAVGVWAVGALSASVMGAVNVGAGSSLLAGAQSGAAWLANTAGLGIHAIGGALAGIPSGLASILGLSGTFAPASVASVNSAAGIMGGAAVAAVATHAAAPYMQQHPFVTLDHVHNTGALATAGMASLPAHDVSHIAHHAAEHADEHAGMAWSQKFSPRNVYANFADNVRGQKSERNMPAPAQNYTEQLNADRASLDTVLAK